MIPFAPPPGRCPVSRQSFEAALARVDALGAPADRRLGILGPGSAAWEVLGESVVVLGGMRAGLLQIAHPTVAQGVHQHSVVLGDVHGRLRRTLSNVYTLVFGDRDTAEGLARAVFEKHRRVAGRHAEGAGPFTAGDPYRANDLDGLLWVGATLVDTALYMVELLRGPLPTPLRDRFVDEARRLFALFGIPPQRAPGRASELTAYMEGMLDSDRLTVGAAGAEMARVVLTPPTRWAAPAFAVLRPFTASTLPPRLREAFGLTLGARDRAIAAAFRASIRHAGRRAPPRLRRAPGWWHAQRRLAGRPGPDPLANLLREVALMTVTGGR